ncbi:biotin synthase BioB [Mangrovibacterium marinum]|uniref:biotin synthase BioB n=1 Tax=Mangrovibacterium marinum TaxID=1639118 RepID=UPI002A18A2FE|nr:biotin synthase BioB [Mangrovibacterium marinum]
MINIEELKEKVLAGYQLSYDEGVELYHTADKEALYHAADEIREHFCGNTIDLCSITNAKSGRCPQDCKWCSQSRHYNTNVEEYEVVDRQEALDQALVSAQKGVRRHSLVTSGRRVYNKTLDQLIPIYKKIKEKTDLSLCASMGLIDEGQLRRLQEEVGIEHYHCNLETAPSYFPELVSTHSIDEKIITIKTAQKLGIKVCSGGIIGMGETAEHRVELAATLADLGVHSIPINILTPVEGTPLEGTEMLTEEEILSTFAVFRFMNPKANIRFAGGRIQIKPYQHKALRAGVSAALTGDYLTTTGSKIEDDLRDFQEAGFSTTH